jgi:UDP-2-acetamido-2-deoxy-ribo-hexuluronate aminotransferase
VLLVKLDIFDQEVAARQQVAENYREALQNHVTTPLVAPDRTSVWAQYSVLSDRRAELRQKLQEDGIPTAVYYPTPLHLQQAFAALGYGVGDFPVSEDVARRIFSLPMHPYLSKADQDRIIRSLGA